MKTKLLYNLTAIPAAALLCAAINDVKETLKSTNLLFQYFLKFLLQPKA